MIAGTIYFYPNHRALRRAAVIKGYYASILWALA